MRILLGLFFHVVAAFAVGDIPKDESPAEYQSIFKAYRNQLLKKGVPADAVATAGVSSGGGTPSSRTSCDTLTISQHGKPIGEASICTYTEYDQGNKKTTEITFDRNAKDLISENFRTPCPSNEKPATAPDHKEYATGPKDWFCASLTSIDSDFPPEVSALLMEPKFHKALMGYIANQKKQHKKVKIVGSTIWFNGIVATVALKLAVKSDKDPKATWVSVDKIGSQFNVSPDGKIRFSEF